MLFIVPSIFMWAQVKTVTGKVTNEKGESVPYATIKEAGTKNVVSGDESGKFSIKIKTGSSIVVSSGDYAPAKVSPVDGLNTVVLVSAGKEVLQEVVVGSLGIKRQAKELGYSTATIKSGDLTKASPVNLQNGLTGKVSGLNIQTTNNGVFGDTRITLRGIRSLTGNNQPLLVLDGVPISLGYINSVNPNDIDNVSILKSAAATIEYGPDGVNGAIVITTKKGYKSKPSVAVSQTVQWESVSYLPKFQTQYGAGGAYSLDGSSNYDHYIHIPFENQSFGPAYDGSLVQIGRIAPDGSKNMITYKARPEEKRNFWNTGVTSQTNISLSTGDFYLSAQDVDIKGVMPGDKNHRTVIKASSNKEYGKLTTSFSVSYTRGYYDVTSGSGSTAPYYLLLNTPMEIPITKYKNWKTDYWASPNGYFNDYYMSPYFAIDNYRGTGQSDDVLGNVQLDYKITPWLSATYRIGAQISSSTSQYTQGQFVYSDFAKNSGMSIAKSGDIGAAVSDGSQTSSVFNNELFVSAKRQVKSFSFDVLVGGAWKSKNVKSVDIAANQLISDQLYNEVYRTGELGSGTGTSISKTFIERYFAKATIGYDKWIYLDLTESFDRDSRLFNHYNANESFGYFYPGASVSFVLNEGIDYLKNINWLSYLKLRGSMNRTANVNMGAYQLQSTYSPGTNFPFSNMPGFTANNTFYQSGYQPEQVINKEVGLEFGFLKNKISLEATYYNQDNSKQILNASASSATGYTRYLLNAASFVNKGIEFDLKLNPLFKTRDFNVNLKLNYTYQENKVYNVLDGTDELGIGNLNYVIKGKSAYTFKMTDYLRDAAGHPVVDPATGYPSTNPNNATFGTTAPDKILGFTADVNWKQFSLSFTIDHRSGNQIYSDIGRDIDFSGISARSATNNRTAFIFPNSVYDDGSTPGTPHYVTNTNKFVTTPTSNFWSSDANINTESNYLASASFWKLREVSISYEVPQKSLTKLRYIKRASIAITGRNLITLLPKTNQWTDPEFSLSTGNAQGVNTADIAPPTRIFGFNVNLQF